MINVGLGQFFPRKPSDVRAETLARLLNGGTWWDLDVSPHGARRKESLIEEAQLLLEQVDAASEEADVAVLDYVFAGEVPTHELRRAAKALRTGRY